MRLSSFAFIIFSSISVYACDVAEDFNYCVNTMWANKERDKMQQYVAPLKCLENAKEWHETLGENDAINFWYDGDFISKNALAQTKEYCERYSQLGLCDIRDLGKVKLHEEVFRAPIPFFFRVDILREEASLVVAAQKKFKYIVYADQDVPVMKKDALFYKDKWSNSLFFSQDYETGETLKSLKRFGLTACKANDDSDTHVPENSFCILDRDSPHMLQAREIGLVDINILRAKTALERGGYGTGEDYYKKNPMKECAEFVDMQQLVWSSFPGMMKLYHLKTGKGVLTNERFEPDPSFNRDTYNWIDLFDLESHHFQKYTQMDVQVNAHLDGTGIFETIQYAPSHSKSICFCVHKKRVGQPKSQFVH